MNVCPSQNMQREVSSCSPDGFQSTSSNRKECGPEEMGTERADGLQAEKKLFFLRAPKLGNGKSPLSFFHRHLHTLEIGKKIGSEERKGANSSGLMLRAVGLITSPD